MNTLGFRKAPSDTRVVVAMSGGVDSSVAAALMTEQGFEVIGLTMQLYDHGEATNRKNSCCAGQDIYDAKRVADSLNIPHYVLNYEDRFKEKVIEKFAASYLAGETPIPCVRCNQTVKFQDLLGYAHSLGADALITGHYVRRIEGPGGAELHRAKDGAKDQSYFLFATTPQQLDFLRFPLGDLEKSETRAHAERFSLPVADKPDSQDICFVPNGSYAEIVKKLHPGASEAGEIIDERGCILGQHDGIIHFTVGQRKGLGIASSKPLYVIKIDPEMRQVVAGPKASLMRNNLRVHDVNWLGNGEAPNQGLAVTVKLRSSGEPVPARILNFIKGQASIMLDEPQAGIAPGQACVFYQGERTLGGGWIERGDT
jgi:tRNA-specific 2-thiouridylase